MADANVGLLKVQIRCSNNNCNHVNIVPTVNRHGHNWDASSQVATDVRHEGKDSCTVGSSSPSTRISQPLNEHSVSSKSHSKFHHSSRSQSKSSYSKSDISSSPSHISKLLPEQPSQTHPPILSLGHDISISSTIEEGIANSLPTKASVEEPPHLLHIARNISISSTIEEDIPNSLPTKASVEEPPHLLHIARNISISSTIEEDIPNSLPTKANVEEPPHLLDIARNISISSTIEEDIPNSLPTKASVEEPPHLLDIARNISISSTIEEDIPNSLPTKASVEEPPHLLDIARNMGPQSQPEKMKDSKLKNNHSMPVVKEEGMSIIPVMNLQPSGGARTSLTQLPPISLPLLSEHLDVKPSLSMPLDSFEPSSQVQTGKEETQQVPDTEIDTVVSAAALEPVPMVREQETSSFIALPTSQPVPLVPEAETNSLIALATSTSSLTTNTVTMATMTLTSTTVTNMTHKNSSFSFNSMGQPYFLTGSLFGNFSNTGMLSTIISSGAVNNNSNNNITKASMGDTSKPSMYGSNSNIENTISDIVKSTIKGNNSKRFKNLSTLLNSPVKTTYSSSSISIKPLTSHADVTKSPSATTSNANVTKSPGATTSNGNVTKSPGATTSNANVTKSPSATTSNANVTKSPSATTSNANVTKSPGATTSNTNVTKSPSGTTSTKLGSKMLSPGRSAVVKSLGPWILPKPVATSVSSEAVFQTFDESFIPMKDRVYDANKHCGVIVCGKPCKKYLTCKLHALSMKRYVQGRRLHFDELLKEYKYAKHAYLKAKSRSNKTSPALKAANSVNKGGHSTLPVKSQSLPPIQAGTPNAHLKQNVSKDDESVMLLLYQPQNPSTPQKSSTPTTYRATNDSLQIGSPPAREVLSPVNRMETLLDDSEETIAAKDDSYTAYHPPPYITEPPALSYNLLGK